MLPQVLLPATTALGTAEEGGRKLGVLAGANVVMPNLSPAGVRKKYMLYDNKLSGGSEAAEHLDLLKKEMGSIGLRWRWTGATVLWTAERTTRRNRKWD